MIASVFPLKYSQYLGYSTTSDSTGTEPILRILSGERKFTFLYCLFVFLSSRITAYLQGVSFIWIPLQLRGGSSHLEVVGLHSWVVWRGAVTFCVRDLILEVLMGQEMPNIVGDSLKSAQTRYLEPFKTMNANHPSLCLDKRDLPPRDRRSKRISKRS